MTIPPYDFPSATLLGAFAALGLFGLFGSALRQSGKPGSQKRQLIPAAIVFLSAVTMTLTTAHLFVVQVANTEEASNIASLHSSSTSVLALCAQSAVMFVLVAAVIITLYRRKSVGTAYYLLLLAMSFTTFADMAHFVSFGTYWYYGVTLGWFLTAAFFIALVVMTAVKVIRSYGARKHEDGQRFNADRQSCDFVASFPSEYQGLVRDVLFNAKMSQ